VILDTSTLAGTIAATASDALLAPFRADEVWESLGEFARVRLKAITADALVAQRFLLPSVKFYAPKLLRELLTGSQVLALVVADDPGSWRQRRGQDLVCEVHHEATLCQQARFKTSSRHTSRSKGNRVWVDIVCRLSLNLSTDEQKDG
jgi:hypothetical protein